MIDRRPGMETKEGGAVKAPSPTNVDKHPYVTEKRITEGLSAGQQEFIRVYNSMRKWIIDHGGMEEKS